MSIPLPPEKTTEPRLGTWFLVSMDFMANHGLVEDDAKGVSELLRRFSGGLSSCILSNWSTNGRDYNGRFVKLFLQFKSAHAEDGMSEFLRSTFYDVSPPSSHCTVVLLIENQEKMLDVLRSSCAPSLWISPSCLEVEIGRSDPQCKQLIRSTVSCQESPKGKLNLGYKVLLAGLSRGE